MRLIKLLKIIRWLWGYVAFAAKGAFPERFINLTAKAGISLWDIKKENSIFSASVLAGEYKNLRPLARKAKIKLKIKEKHGLPFILNKYKYRSGLFIGIILFFVVIYSLSLFVWDIEIEGNIDIEDTQVKQTLSELGLSKGKLIKKLDIPIIEQGAMQKLSNVSWISINLDGCLATVSIKERIIPPDILPEDRPCNIKANHDGQIMNLEVYKGTPLVKNGDAVLKGQLLVSGVVEDNFGNNNVYHAVARAYAYTKRCVEKEVDLKQIDYERTGKIVKRKKINLFGIDLPLSLSAVPKCHYEKEIIDKDIKILNSQLPINIYEEIYYEQKGNEVVLSKDEAINKVKCLFDEYENENMQDIKILDRQKKEWMNEEKYKAQITYYCLEDIAISEEIVTQ